MTLTLFEKRLGLVLGILTIFQLSLFGFITSLYQIQGFYFFYPLAFVYHLIVLAVLFLFRIDFTHLDGTPLKKIGLPNLLTLIRLSSLPTIMILFLIARGNSHVIFPLLIIVIFAFLTDLADGFLARKFNMGTRLGQLLDSSSDYVVLFSLTILLSISEVLPFWLLGLIFFRLLFQIVGMSYITIYYKKQFLETTFLGKASLFSLMVLYALEILIFLGFPLLKFNLFVIGFEIFIGIMMIVSTIDKAIYFVRKVKQERKKK